MRRMVRSIMLGGLLVTLSSALPAAADPDYSLTGLTYFYSAGFNILENSSGSSSAIALADDLFVSVAMDGPGFAYFTFWNWGTSGGSVTDIYWDESNPLVLDPGPTSNNSNTTNFNFVSTLSGNFSATNWDTNVAPGVLPGGADLDPAFSVHFGTDTWTGRGHSGSDGILDGGYATFRVALASGYTGQSTLEQELTSGDLRFGLHIQSIDDTGGSASYYSPIPIDDPPPLDDIVVPVPAAAGLGFLGMALVGFVRRKKS